MCQTTFYSDSSPLGCDTLVEQVQETPKAAGYMPRPAVLRDFMTASHDGSGTTVQLLHRIPGIQQEAAETIPD